MKYLTFLTNIFMPGGGPDNRTKEERIADELRLFKTAITNPTTKPEDVEMFVESFARIINEVTKKK